MTMTADELEQARRRLGSDYDAIYGLGADGPFTRFTKLVDQRQKELEAEGFSQYEAICAAQDQIVKEQPHTWTDHNLWCAALASGDESELPAYLLVRFRDVRDYQKRQDEAAKREAEAEKAALEGAFDTAGHPITREAERIRLARFADLPRAEGFSKALDEVGERHPDAVRAWLEGRRGN